MDAADRFFFIHVMKTGGATFRQHFRQNFGPDQIYPQPDAETVPAIEFNLLVDYVRNLPPERLDRLRCVGGHFPYMLTEVLPWPVRTMTLVRDPVARNLSYLKQRRLELGAETLDEVYDDDFIRKCMLDEHQTKVFSLGPDDDPESVFDVVTVDERRFETACANLERVEVVGVTEQFADFRSAVADGFGWVVDSVPDKRVADPVEVSADLRERIAADNPHDAAFHRYARDLVARRARR